MNLRVEELKRILENNPINAKIIEEEEKRTRNKSHHEDLVKFIRNYHQRQFNTIAISMGKPENTMMICDRIFRVYNNRINYEPSEVQKAYDNIQEINKALYYLYCKII